MNAKLKNFFSLLFVFMKIGLFTFGGGYAMISLIEKEVIEKKKWISNDDMLEIIAISETTPGPIAINCATFVGYKVGGFLGAFGATLGTVLPSFTIILLISLILNEFQQNKTVQYAFFGIRAGVLALIIKALFTMYKASKKSLFSYLMMLLAFLLTAFFKVNVLLVIVACGFSGVLFTFFQKRRGEL